MFAFFCTRGDYVTCPEWAQQSSSPRASKGGEGKDSAFQISEVVTTTRYCTEGFPVYTDHPTERCRVVRSSRVGNEIFHSHLEQLYFPCAVKLFGMIPGGTEHLDEDE